LRKDKKKYLAILKEKRKISVGEMSEHFNVSGATIRTDLRLMEESGQLTRTHGGAILRTRASFEMGSDLRESLHIDAKARIGARAAQLVEDGDIIVLDTGTTTLHIAHHLRDRKNLTVITNDFAIARVLEEASGVQLVLLGGMVKKRLPLCDSGSGRPDDGSSQRG
jgi:Transcriptional regulators of sugar metabolism